MLDGDPVLIDFGIAHVADDVRITMTGLVMGTPGYLSPEVVEGAPVTEATDWWGWAATLAFAASGAPPFGRGPMDVVLTRVSRGEADLTRRRPAPRAAAVCRAVAATRASAPTPTRSSRPSSATPPGRPVTEALSAPPRHTQVLEHRPHARSWDRPAGGRRSSMPVDHEPWARAPAAPPDPEQRPRALGRARRRGLRLAGRLGGRGRASPTRASAGRSAPAPCWRCSPRRRGGGGLPRGGRRRRAALVVGSRAPPTAR